MKTKQLCLSLLLVLTGICALAPRLLANDGDWTELTDVKWWWKYVRTASVASLSVDKVKVVAVPSTKIGYAAQQFTFTITNIGGVGYKGGDTYRMESGYCEPDPVPWRGPSTWTPDIIAKGSMPALAVGQSVQITGIAYIPEKGTYDKYVKMNVGQ